MCIAAEGLAPGFRDAHSGDRVTVGNYGFSWSSATSDIRGLDLNFHSQYLDTGSSDNRAHGFQLRCLSE
ncbi:hypothetical protein [uncultured Rikenella sp.]|uniref:hypothetical protein n=1 Tax=uncultured Rikenella sp. TaxID=368003 RepID=UPI00272C9AAA|nr:hypothetical protein [uncultured Rikenella sp.]